MSSKNAIGLKKAPSKELTSGLNKLLSHYQVFYINVRGFHWNIKGNDFFTLHIKFEELYTELQEKIDAIAERIRIMDATPLHAFTDYLEKSSIKEVKDVSDAEQSVQYIVAGLQKLVEVCRDIIDTAQEDGDEGTADLLTGYMRDHEKLIWMYTAYLG